MNTPLRDEIEALCQKMFACGVEVGKLNKYYRTSKETVIAAEDIDEILNLIASKMPEKKAERILHKAPSMLLADEKAIGFNEAIDSVISILKGGTE